MLKLLIFIFDGGFDPVVAVQINTNAALIKAVLAVKFCLYDKGEVGI